MLAQWSNIIPLLPFEAPPNDTKKKEEKQVDIPPPYLVSTSHRYLYSKRSHPSRRRAPPRWCATRCPRCSTWSRSRLIWRRGRVCCNAGCRQHRCTSPRRSRGSFRGRLGMLECVRGSGNVAVSRMGTTDVLSGCRSWPGRLWGCFGRWEDTSWLICGDDWGMYYCIICKWQLRSSEDQIR